MPSADAILRRVPFLAELQHVLAGRRAYLVGGAVRDALLGQDSTDFDFVVADPFEVAGNLARRTGGRLVRLHDELPTARIVWRPRSREPFQADLVQPRASSLRADLECRDFTVNAMAAGPVCGRARLFDPCGGRGDLACRLVRMTSRASLADDPVRAVRAYRFAAQLGFRLDRSTRRQCARLAEAVAVMPGERLGAEVVAMLGADRYPRPLRALAADGVLGALLPEFEAAAGVPQLGVHQFDVAGHSLLTAQRLGQVMREARRLFPEHAEDIASYLESPERRAGLVLAGLLHDLGKPDCRVWSEGRWRFFEHEQRGLGIARAVSRRLRLPRRLRRQTETLVGLHVRVLPFTGSDEPTGRARRRLLREAGPHGVGLVLLCLADRRALRAGSEPKGEKAILGRLRRLLAATSEARGREQALVTGVDLIELGMTPGPVFSEVLQAVEGEWLEGRLTGKEQALAWVRSRWLGSQG